MDSERIPCGLPTVTSPPKGQASEYEKKIFPYIRFPVAFDWAHAEALPQGISIACFSGFLFTWKRHLHAGFRFNKCMWKLKKHIHIHIHFSLLKGKRTVTLRDGSFFKG